MLIFDSFPTRVHAENFVIYLNEKHGRAARVFGSQAESDKHDPFPHPLTPPIVLVRRDSANGEKIEPAIREIAKANYGGRFAGT